MRPKRRKKKVPGARKQKQSGGIAGGTVLTGIGMIVGTIIWFFGGLFFMDIIFFYPPVLLVVGLVTFVKGLMGNE